MIPVLLAFLGLVLVAACAEFLRQARRLDRMALLVLILLGLWTRPDLGHHRAAVATSIMSDGPRSVMLGTTARAAAAGAVARRLEYRDLLVLSLTTLDGGVIGLGLFGRVFVLDGLPDHRR